MIPARSTTGLAGIAGISAAKPAGAVVKIKSAKAKKIIDLHFKSIGYLSQLLDDLVIVLKDCVELIDGWLRFLPFMI